MRGPQVNRMYEEMLQLGDTERATEPAARHAIPTTGAPLPSPARSIQAETSPSPTRERPHPRCAG
ncbi:hypothetical protein ACWV95_14635 [Streptomyces albus]